MSWRGAGFLTTFGIGSAISSLPSSVIASPLFGHCERSEGISSLLLCRLYIETASGHRAPRSDIWGRWRRPRPLPGLAVTCEGSETPSPHREAHSDKIHTLCSQKSPSCLYSLLHRSLYPIPISLEPCLSLIVIPS